MIDYLSLLENGNANKKRGRKTPFLYASASR